jgi:predicted nucleic acid-binding protein
MRPMPGDRFFDTNILIYAFAAGAEAKCRRLVTEDLQHGRKFGDVTVENPFLEES